MDHGYPNQGPTSSALHEDDEPLFTSPPEERSPSLRRPPQLQQQQIPTTTFGAPPMGEPSEPSAHPDNITAATQTTATGPASVTRPAPQTTAPAAVPAGGGGGLGRQPSGSFGKATLGGLGRQPSGSFDKAALGGGLGRQPSGSFDKAALGGGGGLGRQPSGSFDKAALGGGGGLGRQPSGSFDKAALGGLGGGGGGLRRQPSGAYDAATASKTDKGFAGGAPAAASVPNSQPGLVPPPTSIPVGAAPAGPYMKTEEVPPSGTSPMNMIVENFNKYMSKAEGLAGNIWSHMKTGPSVTDAARGRVSQGIKLVQEGGFEGLYKSTFGPMSENEQLRKTYACYLSTTTGPVAGTLYISNLKFSFSSDRPLAYKGDTGLQAWSYYKMVVPLEKVKSVVSSFNESKPLEKYIQVVTTDGHDFWFMGFVNYDKGVKNMQLALEHIGEVDPNGGLKAPWAGMSVPGMKKQSANTVPVAGTQQSASTVPVAGHNSTPGGPAPNQPTETVNPTV